MKLRLYSVRDCVAGEYSVAFLVATNNAVAVRDFQHRLKNADMIKYDCQLYCVGLFNTETGEIEGMVPEFVCNYEEADV